MKREPWKSGLHSHEVMMRPRITSRAMLPADRCYSHARLGDSAVEDIGALGNDRYPLMVLRILRIVRDVVPPRLELCDALLGVLPTRPAPVAHRLSACASAARR